MARRVTTKKADTTVTAKTASVKETPAKSVAAAPAKKVITIETSTTEDAKVTASKPAEKPAEKKAPAKKAAPVKKTAPAKRTAASKKAEAPTTEVYIQFWGKEVYAKDIVESVKKIWTSEMGKKESDLKDLKVYIKPEDNGVHYVINGEITGFFQL